MDALTLIAVIVVLVVVHEFGHFIAAKLSGMRVDEFGLGYPPRARTLGKKGETVYTLNWIPFGGFVKIHGEDGSEKGDHDPRAFGSKNRFVQAIVLVAGVTMNALLAYVLIVSALMLGTPRAIAPEEIAVAQNVQLLAAEVLPASPADIAGLKPGDVVLSAVHARDGWNPGANNGKDSPTHESFTSFVSASEGNALKLSVDRNGEEVSLAAEPAKGTIEDDPDRYALGVVVATIGVIPLTFTEAVVQGASMTWGIIEITANGLAQFFSSIFTFSANFSQVSGPVGIAGIVGSASAAGLGNLLTIVAIISINLALINLIPIPALDGGRLLFVIIESVTRTPIKPSVSRAVNSIGFVLLILLMLVVTAHDIFKLVS